MAVPQFKVSLNTSNNKKGFKSMNICIYMYIWDIWDNINTVSINKKIRTCNKVNYRHELGVYKRRGYSHLCLQICIYTVAMVWRTNGSRTGVYMRKLFTKYEEVGTKWQEKLERSEVIRSICWYSWSEIIEWENISEISADFQFEYPNGLWLHLTIWLSLRDNYCWETPRT